MKEVMRCNHTVEIGSCTLDAGHTLGHHDEGKGAQWWNREDDYGPGAYASIHHGDQAYRHKFRECEEHFGRSFRKIAWCPWCLRYLLNQTRSSVTKDNPALLTTVDEALDL